MKEKKFYLLLISFYIFFILFSPLFLFAQPGGPGGGGDPGCDPQDNTNEPGLVCPIDSYIFILLGIGVIYGIKKVKDLQNPSDNNSAKILE